MAHTDTHRIFFATKAALSWRNGCIFVSCWYPVSPPNQKKNAPNFFARVFSVTKPKPSAPGFPAGRGFRVSAMTTCADLNAPYSRAELKRVPDSQSCGGRLGGGSQWMETVTWYGLVFIQVFREFAGWKIIIFNRKYVFKRLLLCHCQVRFQEGNSNWNLLWHIGSPPFDVHPRYIHPNLSAEIYRNQTVVWVILYL